MINSMLKVESICKRYPRFSLHEITLHVEKGEYYILFGPTGAGKSLIFEIIAGIRKPDSGQVFIGNKELTNRDPSRRNIGYVPQDYALIPFKTVRQNIAFGLEARKLPMGEKKKRISEILTLLGIEHLADRKPDHLSGGEKQRVTLGRALVIQPDILLLDEPLSAVDENTGDQLMKEIKTLHKQLGMTILHICHRLEEVFYLADRMAVIQDGIIVQTGTPRQIYHAPSNAFVANLLKVKNVIPGEVKKKNADEWFYIAGQPLIPANLPAGTAYAVIPPNKIGVYKNKPAPVKDEVILLPCTVQTTESWKPVPEVVLDVGFPLHMPADKSMNGLSPSETGWVALSKKDIRLLPG